MKQRYSKEETFEDKYFDLTIVENKQFQANNLVTKQYFILSKKCLPIQTILMRTKK